MITLLYIALSCCLISFDCVNLDDDLEIDMPEAELNPVNYPKTGKDFDVTIRIKEPFNEKLLDRSSKEFNLLRNKIQLGILKLYVDNDYYQGVHILEFSNSTSINARLFMRFTQSGTDHLEPLNRALVYGMIGDVPVNNFFVNATVANYNLIQTILCGIECSSANTCQNDKCSKDCCEIMLATATNQAPLQPQNTAGVMNSLLLPAANPVDSAVYYRPVPVPTPAMYQQYQQSSNYPVYGNQQYYQQDPRSGFCSNGCSDFCYPTCSPTCCNSLRRSVIPRRFYQPYYFPRI